MMVDMHKFSLGVLSFSLDDLKLVLKQIKDELN